MRRAPEINRTAFTDLEELSACILCGKPVLTRVPCQPQLSRCRACGHIQLNPRPTQSAIAASYDIEDVPDAVHSVWEAQRQGRATMWAKRAGRVHAIAGEPGRALDVGAGFGDFLQLLREAGWTVEGTELSAGARAVARARGLALHAGQLEDVDLQTEGFDLITLWHVLEHLPLPGKSLTELYGLLRPGGLLVIGVPNDSLWPRLALLSAKDSIQRLRRRAATAVDATWGSRGVGEEVHLSFFAPRRLATALTIRGFVIVELGLDDHIAESSPATDRQFARNDRIWRLARVNLHRTLFVAARRPSSG